MRQLLVNPHSLSSFSERKGTFGFDVAVDDRGLELVSVGTQCGVPSLQLAVAQAVSLITF